MSQSHTMYSALVAKFAADSLTSAWVAIVADELQMPA